MGVPGLFRTLVKKYPQVLSRELQWKTDQLLFDYNCLVHHCVHLLPSTAVAKVLEETLLAKTVGYTNLIVKVVNPKNVVYIALDGPVPMGKLMCQRSRRYKKVLDDSFARKMATKYNIPANSNFNSSAITPGTVFMAKLVGRLQSAAKLGAFGDAKVYLSDSNVPGEGEQKISRFVSNGQRKPNGESPNIVMYGMDADLVVLAMMLCTKYNSNILLMREDADNPSEFVFLNVNILIDSLISEYKLFYVERTQFVKDFAFISMFGGNDFVDPFVHTKMREGGLDSLLNAYSKTLSARKNGTALIDENNSPVYSVFEAFLSHVAESEVEYTVPSSHMSCDSSDTSYDTELEMYQHALYSNPQNPFYKRYHRDLQKFTVETYHSHFFADASKDALCKQYLHCVKWTFVYYSTMTPPSWLWYYTFRNAPLCSTLTEYVRGIGPRRFAKLWSSLDFPCDVCIPPLLQLLCVLPKEHAHLLPFSYSRFVKDNKELLEQLMPNPQSLRLDAAKGLKNIYSDLLMEPINLRAMHIIASGLPLSPSEFARNKVKKGLVEISKR